MLQQGMSGLANYPRALAIGGNQATATVVHGPYLTLSGVSDAAAQLSHSGHS